MADFTLPQPRINFITSNPALDEYLRSQKAARDQDSADADTALKKQKLQNTEQEQPTRLRTLSAGATTAEAEASSATQTAPLAGATASAKLDALTTEVGRLKQQLDEATKAQPSKLRQVGAGADTAEAEATTAQANAKVAAPKAQAGLDQMQALVRATDANTASIYIGIYQKQLERAAQGDVAGPQAIAQQAGIKGIPDAVLQSEQGRGAIANIISTAQQRYPNRPKDQFAFIAGHLADIAQRSQQQPSQGMGVIGGGAPNQKPIDPQTAPYENLPGDPPIPETGGQTNSGEQERHIAALRAADKNLSYAEALKIAQGHGGQEEIERERLAQEAFKTDKAQEGKHQFKSIDDAREYYKLPRGDAAQAAPPRPPGLPANTAYNPARKIWADVEADPATGKSRPKPGGNFYDASGQVIGKVPVQQQQPAQQAAPAPQVPISQ